MTDEELVKRLRVPNPCCEEHHTQNEAADRIEALEAKLAKAVEEIEALEWFSEVSAADAIATKQRLAKLAEIEGEKTNG